MHQVQIDTPTPAGPPPALPPADPCPGGRFTPPAIARTACGNDRHSLRARFLRAGSDAVDDRELLELLLSRFHAAGNAGLLAASLLDTFGSPARVLAAHPDRLRSVDGLSEAGVCAIKTAEALGIRLAPAELPERPRPGFDDYGKVLDYCRTLAGHKPVEQFHVLFLDTRNRLIRQECHQVGTINHAPAYPREICIRALQLAATALIAIHNHPSGLCEPSKADIDMTLKIRDAAKTIGVTLHDHIIVAAPDALSFKARGLL